MEFPPYIAFTSEDQQMTVDGVPNVTVRVITCLTQELTQDEMPAGKGLIVYGDDITIKSALSLPGQNLTIIARNVTLAPGASVDLSGAAAASTGDAKAENGQPGASAQHPDATDGTKGSAGNAGQNAGNFTLVAGAVSGTLSVTCNGGKGSKGQNGGDGGTGLDGAKGDNYQTRQVSGPPNSEYALVHDGQRGVNGGREGAGGAGGNGGQGGNGGAVIVAYGAGSAPDVTTSCLAGDGGDFGRAGANGSRAGQGGAGGSIAKYVSEGGKGGSFSGYIDSGNFAPSGAPGAVPPGPSADGYSGKKGNAGSFAVITAPDFYGTYSPSIEQQLLALRQAEFFYLGGTAADYENAAQLLLWLSRITTPPLGVIPPAGDVRAQMHARANALLTQLSEKLDFYGEPANHVPLGSLNYYQTTLPVELAAGGVTETSYNNYTAQAGQQAAQVKTLQDMLAQSATQLTTLNASRQPLVDQIGLYQTAVKNLLLARNQQGVVFANAEAKWESQVIAKLQSAAAGAQCKSYTDIFGIVGNIVTVNPDDLAKLKNSLGFGQSIFGGLQTILRDESTWDNAVQQLEAAEGDVGSIVTAASNLAADSASGDSGKIAVDRATFEAMLLPYKSMDATGELEAQLNLYLAKSEAFSQKQLDYDALQIQLLNLDANIAQKQAEHDSIQNQLSLASNPEIAIYKAFAARTYGETLDRLIRDVYGLYQAYRYWALADYTFPPGDGNWTMAYLSSIESDLNGKVNAIIENFGGGTHTTTQTFDYRPADGPGWVINDPQQLAAFKTTGALDFTILIDNNPWVSTNFAGFAQVVATDFAVDVHGATLSSKQLFVRLTHSGQAPFLDQSGKRWLFSHVPVSTSYKYDIPSGSRLAGGSLSGADNVQIGLSPFTTWTLNVNHADNPGLSLDAVDQIVLKFAGRFLQNNASKAAKRQVLAGTAVSQGQGR